MYNNDGLYGMDQVHPMMGENHELFDYSENYTNNMDSNINKVNKEEEIDDDKYLIKEEDNKKEKFTQEQPVNFIPQSKYPYIPSTNYLLQQFYSKISTNISYLFVIFILIVVCIAQKNSIDQMKLLLMISLNNNSPVDLTKLPMT